MSRRVARGHVPGRADARAHARDLADHLDQVLDLADIYIHSPGYAHAHPDNLDRAIIRARELADDLGRSRGRCRDLVLTLDLAEAHATDLVHAVARARSLDLDLDHARDLASALARYLARARELAGELAQGRSKASARSLGLVTRALLTSAVRQLPERDWERYWEEWAAELHHLQRRRTRWIHGVQLVKRAPAVARALRWQPTSHLDRQQPW